MNCSPTTKKDWITWCYLALSRCMINVSQYCTSKLSKCNLKTPLHSTMFQTPKYRWAAVDLTVNIAGPVGRTSWLYTSFCLYFSQILSACMVGNQICETAHRCRIANIFMVNSFFGDSTFCGQKSSSILQYSANMAVWAQFILVCLTTIRREKACVPKFGPSVVFSWAFHVDVTFRNLLWGWDEGRAASDSVSRKQVGVIVCFLFKALQSCGQRWHYWGSCFESPLLFPKIIGLISVVISFLAPLIHGKLIVSELQSSPLITLYRSDCGVLIERLVRGDGLCKAQPSPAFSSWWASAGENLQDPDWRTSTSFFSFFWVGVIYVCVCVSLCVYIHIRIMIKSFDRVSYSKFVSKY